jgi:hypothetical protein
MKRRNFLALLFAPFVARFVPKSAPKRNINDLPFEFSIKPGTLDEITRIQRELSQIMIQTIYTNDRRIKILGPGGVTLADFESPHERIPFVIFES